MRVPDAPDAPSGTITFLFSDIEGSTRRWEEHPQAMKVALALHDDILREAIEANGGYIFQTIGDAFCAAFATASQALSAAVRAQQALFLQDWGEIGTLRVRMALHTGAADHRDGTGSAGGDYFGPTFDRAARLLPIGHGGQTLLTMPTEQLVRDLLPKGVTLSDMGERRFRDLLHSEHVFGVLVEGLPHDFAPLKTLEGAPNNLPVRSTSLIGRDRELDACKTLLSRPDVRLLTLLGPGGIGKTRLSLHLGAAMLDHFADGVFAVALAHITDAALVGPAIAQALGVRQSGSQPIVESLKDYLHNKRILLILDNFEQVLEAAILLWELLSVAPMLKMLVTSRSALNLAAEQIYEVPSLSMPEPDQALDKGNASEYEAINLFVERARAVKSDFALTIDNAQAIAGICAQLDGLPLAIELAAARIKILSPQMMLSRLKLLSLPLTGGALDLPPRQQTLRATIEWSYNLLNEDEKTLFRRLSVFVRGASLEAVEAVADEVSSTEYPVLDTLSSLVSKSLLRQIGQPDGGARFMTLTSIREYSHERLVESGEEETIRERHAHFFLAFAEEAEPQLRQSQQLVWLARLETEHDNLQSALAWAIERGDAELGLRLAGALWRFWYIKSYLSEGRNWLMQLLALPQAQANTPTRGKALNGAGSLIYNQGDYDLARSLHEQALLIAREIGDRRSIAGALNNLGLIAKARNDYEHAYSLFEQALEINRATGNRSWEAINYNNMANVRYDQGDYPEARSLQERSVVIFTALGDSWGLSMSLADLGKVASEQGDYPAARDLFGRSLALQRDLGDKRNIADTLNKLGVVVLNQSDYAEARSLFEQSLGLFQDLGDKRGIASSRHYLGVLSYRLGDYVTARAYLEESLRSRLQLGDKRDIAESHNNLGLVALGHGDYNRAEAELDMCLQLWRELGNKALIPLSLNNLGVVAICLGEYERALSLLQECLAAAQSLGKKLIVALALLNMGLAHGGQGDFAEAKRLYKQSLQLLWELGDKLHVATCLVRLGTLAALSGASEEALLLVGAAQRMFEDLGTAIPTFERLYYEPAIEAARLSLGEEEATAILGRGRTVSVEQVLANLIEIARPASASVSHTAHNKQ